MIDHYVHVTILHIGEDLIAKVVDLRASLGTFTDTKVGRWIGCLGSKPIYGGYPCSLWTLWHVRKKLPKITSLLFSLKLLLCNFIGVNGEPTKRRTATYQSSRYNGQVCSELFWMRGL